MSINYRNLGKAALFSASLLCASQMVISAANAGGFAVREQSVTGMGMSFAGIAAGSDLSSMFWNPAATANVSGTNAESHLFYAFSETNMRSDGTSTLDHPLAGLLITEDISRDSGNFIEDQPIAAMYFNHQINDKLFLGFGLNSPLGPATEAENEFWSGSMHARNTTLFTLNANPTLAYKINDKITVGAGIQIEYMNTEFEQAVPTLSGSFPDILSLRSNAVVKGDSFGFGYTLGATIKPLPGTTIGIGYRSEIEHDIKGEMTIPALINPLALRLDTRQKMWDPARLTVSVSQEVTPRTKLHGTFEWQNWSVYDEIRVQTSGGGLLGGLIGDIVEPTNWEDGWLLSAGVEHQFNDKLTLRLGGGYEYSPMQTPESRITRLPDSDRYFVSLGGSYKFNDRASVDFSYMHAFVDDAKIEREVPVGLLSFVELNATREASADVFGLSFKYKLGGSDKKEEPEMFSLK